MWKLFYADRTTFSSDDGPWQDAPAWGVMAVTHVDDVVGYARDTGDFYIKPGPQPWSCDLWGLMDDLLGLGVLKPDQRLSDLTADELVAAGVKFGRSVRHDEWREIITWIDSDSELPRKSAHYAHERS